MPDDLAKSFERVRKSADMLNAITEDANYAVRSVEDFLAKQSIGVSAWTLVSVEEDNDECRTYLEYRRVNGRFRIAIVYAAGPVDETVKIWAESTRDEKLATIGSLPSLVTEIAVRAEEKTSGVATAMSAVTQVLKTLEN